MLLYPHERTVIFMDGPNNHGAMKGLSWDLDYTRLKEYFAAKCHLLRVSYYTAIAEERYDTLHTMLDFLEYNGFTVVTKPLKTLNAHDEALRFNKGNMDVDITVHALKIAPHVDHIVLFTGDGDFVPLIEALQEIGKRVTVCSTTKTKVLADDLRRAADNFIELDDLRATCARDPKDRVKAALENSPRNHARTASAPVTS
jgi:uncharacterized LabA/DUF88 family protein